MPRRREGATATSEVLSGIDLGVERRRDRRPGRPQRRRQVDVAALTLHGTDPAAPAGSMRGAGPRSRIRPGAAASSGQLLAICRARRASTSRMRGRAVPGPSRWSFYPRRQHDLKSSDLLGGLRPAAAQDRVRTYSAGMKQKLALLADTRCPTSPLYRARRTRPRPRRVTTRMKIREVLQGPRDSQGKSDAASAAHHLHEVEAHRPTALEFLVQGGMMVAADARSAAIEERSCATGSGCQAARRRGRLPPGATKLRREEPDGSRRCSSRHGRSGRLARSSIPTARQIDRRGRSGVTRLEDLYRELAPREVVVPEVGP